MAVSSLPHPTPSVTGGLWRCGACGRTWPYPALPAGQVSDGTCGSCVPTYRQWSGLRPLPADAPAYSGPMPEATASAPWPGPEAALAGLRDAQARRFQASLVAAGAVA